MVSFMACKDFKQKANMLLIQFLHLFSFLYNLMAWDYHKRAIFLELFAILRILLEENWK